MRLESYPSIFNIGHRAIAELFFDEVTIEEKVDGSQFSFSLQEEGMVYNSKGSVLQHGCCNKLFEKAVNYAHDLNEKGLLELGTIYRGEALCKPKHNTLTYGRSPESGFILFDVQRVGQNYLSYDDKASVASQLGVELVPLLAKGRYNSWDEVKKLLDKESFLGNTNIEGFVVKNYNRFGPDKKVLLGKYVSEAFKEKHSKEWKISNPGRNDIIQGIIQEYKMEARYHKAIQHLREQDLLDNSPKDIGLLMKELHKDVLKEETDRIKDALFTHFWKDISRGIVSGFPEWYKNKLAEGAFNES